MMNLNGKSGKKWKTIIAIIVIVLVLALLLGTLIPALLSQGV